MPTLEDAREVFRRRRWCCGGRGVEDGASERCRRANVLRPPLHLSPGLPYPDRSIIGSARRNGRARRLGERHWIQPRRGVFACPQMHGHRTCLAPRNGIRACASWPFGSWLWTHPRSCIEPFISEKVWGFLFYGRIFEGLVQRLKQGASFVRERGHAEDAGCATSADLECAAGIQIDCAVGGLRERAADRHKAA